MPTSIYLPDDYKEQQTDKSINGRMHAGRLFQEKHPLIQVW
jgi:hypothetical protein